MIATPKSAGTPSPQVGGALRASLDFHGNPMHNQAKGSPSKRKQMTHVLRCPRVVSYLPRSHFLVQLRTYAVEYLRISDRSKETLPR